ncbi:hypothetical protein [Candidatus Lokiarchaeum ossiferum]|uniref:hypothetical protein n=1 Tax=Candidatus Lokiarchaeum ossiferum TaxID=2951803 RepID=UPI00352EEE70
MPQLPHKVDKIPVEVIKRREAMKLRTQEYVLKKKQRAEYLPQIWDGTINVDDVPQDLHQFLRTHSHKDNLWCQQLREDLKAHKITLDDLPPKFWFFSFIKLSDCGLTSLKGMPSELDHVKILLLQDNQLSSLNHFPRDMASLTSLTLDNNPLLSLKGLPSSLPELIWFRADDLPQLSTLEGFPLSAPKLKDISFRNNRLLSLKGLPSSFPSLHKMSFGRSFDPAKWKNPPSYPLRTLSYLSKSVLREMLHFIDSRVELTHLTPQGQALFTAVRRAFHHEGTMDEDERLRIMHHLQEYFDDPRNLAKPKEEPDPEAEALTVRYARDPVEKRRSLAAIDVVFEALWDYYATTPEELAVRYCEDPTTLSKEEYQRLVHEADHADWKILATNLSSSDPILATIEKNHSFRLDDGFSLL